MKRLLLAQSFLLILVGPVPHSFGQNAEDYKVYSAVVRHMFRDGVTQFDMNAKIQSIVIRDQTNSKYASGSDREYWDQVKNRIPLLDDESIAGYESARKVEQRLQAKFDIPLKYQLITDQKLGEIFPEPKNYDRSFEYWKSFYQIYSRSGGYNSFSRVGYDRERRKALVYFVNWCGTLCGTGTYVLVVKGENGWEVSQAGRMWIS